MAFDDARVRRTRSDDASLDPYLNTEPYLQDEHL